MPRKYIHNSNWKPRWTAEEKKQLKNEQDRKKRKMILIAYGGNPPKCACCGESTYQFLAIDHIGGGGTKHRKEVGGNSMLIDYLIKNDFPVGFQILCHNCNCAKGYYGKCPHRNEY